jgi:heme iron utilization protein
MSAITFAEHAKKFLSFQVTGCLGTLRPDGYPGAALVPYDMDQAGRIVIYIAGLTQHFKQLCANPKASFLIEDHFAASDPRPYARAVVYGSFTRVADDELKLLSESYFNRFPESRNYPHDFAFWVCDPESIYWNGGFATAGWVDMPTYKSSQIDSFSYEGMRAVEHMNLDHSDALLTIAKAFCGVGATGTYARMCMMDSKGITVEVLEGKATKRKSVDFSLAYDAGMAPESVGSRAAIIALLVKARELVAK